MKLSLSLKATLSITFTAIIGFLIFGILQYQMTKTSTLLSETESYQAQAKFYPTLAHFLY